MKYRLLRLLLVTAAFGWGVSAFGIIAPWGEAAVRLQALGAREIPDDPMLDYWLRMATGAFTGIGVMFLAMAMRPAKWRFLIPFGGAFMVAEGLVLLVHGLRLGLPPMPFWGDTAFCLFVGAGVWVLRDAEPGESNRVDGT